MKFTKLMLVAALALTPAIAFAKMKASETTTTTTKTTMTTGSVQSSVNVNSASEDELVALFGKKENKAKAQNDATNVIGGRPYAKKEDVMKVIPKLYSSVKGKITVQ